MLDRRYFLVGVAALAWPMGAARAADWKSQYPELTFAVVPAENASSVGDRYAAFILNPAVDPRRSGNLRPVCNHSRRSQADCRRAGGVSCRPLR